MTNLNQLLVVFLCGAAFGLLVGKYEYKLDTREAFNAGYYAGSEAMKRVHEKLKEKRKKHD